MKESLNNGGQFTKPKEEIPEIDSIRLGAFGNQIFRSITNVLDKPLSDIALVKKSISRDDSIAREKFYVTYCKPAINALNLDGKKDHSSNIENYITEYQTLLESVRFLFIQQGIKSYREERIEKGESMLSEKEIEEQEHLRTEITESRSLIQWHILQNESKPAYLETLYEEILDMAETIGFFEESKSMMKGIFQELGVYKIMEKHFKKVAFATPTEDALYKIDFFAETESGKNIIIQSKSAIPITAFGNSGYKNYAVEGVFSEAKIKDMIEKISGENKSKLGTRFSPIVQMKELEENMNIAKKYAENKGLENTEFYLIVASHKHFKPFDFLRDRPKSLKFLESQIDSLAKS